MRLYLICAVAFRFVHALHARSSKNALSTGPAVSKDNRGSTSSVWFSLFNRLHTLARARNHLLETVPIRTGGLAYSSPRKASSTPSKTSVRRGLAKRCRYLFCAFDVISHVPVLPSSAIDVSGENAQTREYRSCCNRVSRGGAAFGEWHRGGKGRGRTHVSFTSS